MQGRKRTGIYRGKIQVRCILRFTFEAVDFRKQEKIRRTALFYLCRYGYPENTPCRFDVVGITGSNIQLIRNAFKQSILVKDLYIDLYRKEADR